MLELMKSNSEDAQDHLRAKTCQREAKEERSLSKRKTLSGHERQKVCKNNEIIFTITMCCENIMREPKYNELQKSPRIS